MININKQGISEPVGILLCIRSTRKLSIISIVHHLILLLTWLLCLALRGVQKARGALSGLAPLATEVGAFLRLGLLVLLVLAV